MSTTEDVKTGGDVVDRSKYSYDTHLFKRADGSKVKSVSNGDAVANVLAGKDRKALTKALKDNGLGEWLKKPTTADLNPGQFRMIAGNMLRNRVKKGEAITVDGVVIKKLDQRVKV